MKIVLAIAAVLAVSAAPLFSPDRPIAVGGEPGSTTVAVAPTVTGVVRDGPTGRPLGGVQVWLDGRSEATLTNPAGRFVLTVEDPAAVGQTFTVRVGALGYMERGIPVRLTAGTVELNVSLKRESRQQPLEDRAAEELEVMGQGTASVAPPPSSIGPPSIAREKADAVMSMVPAAESRRRAGSAAFDPEFNTESYAHIAENGFRHVADHPLSTFSIDVDRASYSNMRRFLTRGQRPPADAVRIEELVNYFQYDYPDAHGEHPFSVTTDMMDAPWNRNHRLVRIGVQGQRIDMSEAPPSNLVFLLDVSGSMNSPDKLPLLKQAFRMLADELRPQDRVAIVVYAGAAGLVLPSTSGTDKETILDALASLEAGGSTAGGAGIRLAYQVAQENFVDGGNNRVILATDGDFNVGASSDSEMIRLIERKREQGTFLTVLGFGTGNLKDSKMEQIADHGNGNYAYIDSPLEARKVLVTEMGGTLLTIAKDVKIQVEFNPHHVAEYRLVGYENRLLANEDFNDDTKDAGELGAGHSVTVLYEVVPAGASSGTPSVDPLRYGNGDAPGMETQPADESDELMFVKLRYKAPSGDRSRLITHPVLAGADDDSIDLRFAAAVASFGMLLRDSEHVRDYTLTDVSRLAESGLGEDERGYRSEFLRLVERAQSLELLATDRH